MKAFIALIGASMTLAGCGSSPATSIVTPAAPDLTGNWQIQSDVTSNIVPPPGVVLFGALESTVSQVTGTFRFANLGQPTQCGLDVVVSVSGSVDSKNNLTLTSSAMPNGTTVKVLLAITGSQQPYSGTGSIEVDGPTCTFPSTGAIGEQVQNASGTYTGTLTPGTLVSPGSGASATVSLALIQSASPQADGRFPATGSFNYTVGTCTGSASLSGTSSGVGIILSSTSAPPANLQIVSFVGTTNATATTIAASVLELAPAPCSTDPSSIANYTGTLTRQ
ncbi:MAG: hypothetical protein WBC92_08865 [Terracidiphilus sp.]